MKPGKRKYDPVHHYWISIDGQSGEFSDNFRNGDYGGWRRQAGLRLAGQSRIRTGHILPLRPACVAMLGRMAKGADTSPKDIRRGQ